MYNLDISSAMAAASAANNSATPRTPEIVNSLIAMTNPLDFVTFTDGGSGTPTIQPAKRFYTNCGASSDSNSSSSSLDSRHPNHHPRHQHHQHQVHMPPQPAPSVQQTCSQLIKAGLKLSIEQKRKLQTSDNEDLLDLDKVKRIKRNESESEEDKHHNSNELTPEDEERRRRRRERNKIAATKCRLKKRERTANLISESETLEAQNVEFKAQFVALRKEKEKLEEVLRQHKAICQKDFPSTGAAKDHQQQPSAYNRLPPVNSIETNGHHHHHHHSYTRPPPATTTTSTTSLPGSGGDDTAITSYQQCLGDFDPTPMYTLAYKPPSIIVETVHHQVEDEHYPSLTDLDNPDDGGFGYNYGQAQQNYGHGIDGCMA